MKGRKSVAGEKRERRVRDFLSSLSHSVTHHLKEVVIYCDGSSLGNGQEATRAAAVALLRYREHVARVRRVSGRGDEPAGGDRGRRASGWRSCASRAACRLLTRFALRRRDDVRALPPQVEPGVVGAARQARPRKHRSNGSGSKATPATSRRRPWTRPRAPSPPLGRADEDVLRAAAERVAGAAG